jgi:methanogenic corrinoid protein MtbC1
MTAAPSDHLEPVRLALRSALVDGDVQTAYRLCLRLLDDGTPFDAIVDGVLMPIQVDLGRRWAAGDISIADEHAATAVIEELLVLLAGGLDSADGREVVVVCPEGDDHSLPGRIVAMSMGLAGLRARFLGSSLPARDLADFCESQRPFAVALSCSVPSALVGASRSVAAAHGLGVPVLVGGRAFGADPTRALRIGADAWAADAPSAVDTIGRWPNGGPALAQPVHPIPETVDLLASERTLIVAAALSRVVDAVPEIATVADGIDRAATELAALVDVTAAAILLDDPAVIREQREWAVHLFAGHDLPVGTITRAMDALADAADGRGFASAAGLLRGAA